MSAWRNKVKALYHLPRGQYRAAEFDDATQCTSRMGITAAVVLGFIAKHPHPNGYKTEQRYSITPTGVDWVEGRVVVVNMAPIKKSQVCATWLASLPQGIHLSPQNVLL